MKPKVMKLWNHLMLRNRFIIKIVFDQLKKISYIAHLGTAVVSAL
nr:transposase [Candidatus Enterovibrio escacola]